VTAATRRLGAAVLVLQAIVLGLAIPVAITVVGVPAGLAVGVGGGLAVAAVVLAGTLRHVWAYVAGSLLQLLTIASGVVVPAMFFLGAIFAALWFTAIWLGRRVEGA
jgi:hypothetical protein